MKGEEAAEYAKLEKEALTTYVNFSNRNRKKISRVNCTLIQMLLPLRIACAGGCTPLMVDDDETNTSKNKKKAPKKKKKKRRIYSASEDESESVEEAPPSPPKPVSKKAQPKKPEVFSEFSFRSKFTVLIEELKKIQDNEPDCK